METLLALASTPWSSLLILSLATYRITRLIVRDEILAAPRDKFFERFPPDRSKLGYLATCEWCMSFWVASLLVICFMISTVTAIVLVPFALSAIAGLLTAYEDK